MLVLLLWPMRAVEESWHARRFAEKRGQESLAGDPLLCSVNDMMRGAIRTRFVHGKCFCLLTRVGGYVLRFCDERSGAAVHVHAGFVVVVVVVFGCRI